MKKTLKQISKTVWKRLIRFEKADIASAKVDSENAEVDIRILEDIHSMKDTQRKRLMKYIEALKQIEALEDME